MEERGGGVRGVGLDGGWRVEGGGGGSKEEGSRDTKQNV